MIVPLAEWIGGAGGAGARRARFDDLFRFPHLLELLPLDVLADGGDPAMRRWLEEVLQVAIDGNRRD